METGPTSFDPGQLIDHQRFLARLARALVVDEHAAEDLVQDTWVAALEGAPTEPPLRGWLGRVLRNRSINSWKLGARRVSREKRVAPGRDSITARLGSAI